MNGIILKPLRLWLSVLPVLCLFLIPGLVPDAKAINGSCVQFSIYYCTFSNPSIAPAAVVYFDETPGANQREWWDAGISDYYGGTVAAKCIGIKSAANGVTATIACGSGEPWGYINGEPSFSLNPSYLWIWHNASGPRGLTGKGNHPGW